MKCFLIVLFVFGVVSVVQVEGQLLDRNDGIESNLKESLSQSSESTASDSNGVVNQELAVSYGTEHSWPMQHSLSLTVLDDNDNHHYKEEEKTSEKLDDSLASEGVTIQQRQLKLYKKYINGCFAKFDQERCIENEKERITINKNQPSFQRNYTSAGFAKVRLPSKVFRMLQDFWNENNSTSVVESWDSASIYTNHWDCETRLLSLDGNGNNNYNNNNARSSTSKNRFLSSHYRAQIIDDVQGILQRWTGVSLSLTSMYGIRIYQNGSILSTHVDRLPLVISAIINVAQDVDEGWVLEVIGHDGKAVNITMEPGDMVLYESHSVLHGRPYPLVGRYYANLFLHFEPIGYSLELESKMTRIMTTSNTGSIGYSDNNRPEESSSQDSIWKKLTTKDLFERALQKFNVLPSKSFSSGSTEAGLTGGKKNSKAKLPSHITEGTIEASRWRQEFVFYRDETNSAKKAEGHGSRKVTSSKYKTAVDNTEALLSSSTSGSKHKTSGVTVAHMVAASGDVSKLKEIAATNPKAMNEPDINGWKPIHEAARSGSIEAVEFLLQPEFGVDVNERTNNGKGATPLWWAEHSLRPGHPVIALLRRHGAIAVGPGVV